MCNNIFKNRIIGKDPNTYTFTKALAEQLLEKECGNVPLVIVRPSVVTASAQEPMPGWIDNIYGPTGIQEISVKHHEGFILWTLI